MKCSQIEQTISAGIDPRKNIFTKPNVIGYTILCSRLKRIGSWVGFFLSFSFSFEEGGARKKLMKHSEPISMQKRTQKIELWSF